MNTQNIASIKPHSNSVTITESTLPTGIIFKNKHLITNISNWHKFIISNADNEKRNNVLRAILDHVHPLDLIPVAFGRDKNESFFFARNCGGAIQKLCNDNLVVRNPINESRPFKLKLILRYTTTSEFKIDVQKNIITVLNKRYDVSRRTLNLSKFHEDSDLTEFCPLSQPKIMFFVLHLSKNLVPLPEKYILEENKIRVLNPFDVLGGNSVLIVLDLKNNLIEDVKNIQPLKIFKLQEFVLDGNPICEKLNHESYVNEIQKLFPNLKKLDGVVLREGNFPAVQRNFIANLEGIPLIEQFLDHYFTLYDSRNRRALTDVYHKSAMFSLNTVYHQGQMSSVTSDLRKYSIFSRNLKKMADFSRNSSNLYKGPTQIMNILCELPACEHDPYSFAIDLMSYTDKLTVIGISGIFREMPENLLDPERYYGFRRTFAIQKEEDGYCKIINEQLHVYNALSYQIMNAFTVSRPVVTDDMFLPKTEKDHQQVIDTLKIITNMNSEWSRKCLEECNFSLKKALMLFVDLYKLEKIPKEGFVSHPNH